MNPSNKSLSELNPLYRSLWKKFRDLGFRRTARLGKPTDLVVYEKVIDGKVLVIQVWATLPCRVAWLGAWRRTPVGPFSEWRTETEFDLALETELARLQISSVPPFSESGE